MFGLKKRNNDLMVLLYVFFKLAKIKGDLALEAHVELPNESPIFQVIKLNKSEQTFICDVLRLLTLGTNNHEDLSRIMIHNSRGSYWINPWKAARYRLLTESIYGHVRGYAPQVSVEFGRQSLPWWCRPAFNELECEIMNYEERFPDERRIKPDPHDWHSIINLSIDNVQNEIDLMEEWKAMSDEKSDGPDV